MATVQSEIRFAKIIVKWHLLAQRRLAHIRELDRSGRWKWYFSEEQFILRRREAESTAILWEKLVSQRSALAVHTDGIRPAA